MKYITIPEEWVKILIERRKAVDKELYDTFMHRDALNMLLGFLESCETLLENKE